ncbi:MAG TPA: copper-binding protein [Gemmataceae bacterium]|nr:copper-binding protein [Gemmataceae bacterium]
MKWTRLVSMLMILFLLGFAGCHGNDAGKDKVYDIKGKIVSVAADKKKVEVDHEAIPGFMGAMTMHFDVEDPKVLDGLKSGDDVQGKLKVRDGKNTIIELKKR